MKLKESNPPSPFERIGNMEYLAYHATQQPDKDAIVVGGGKVTYRRFYADACRMAHSLSKLGIKPGEMVGVLQDDFYVHWVILVALEHLGAAAASFQRSENPSPMPFLQGVDRLIADGPVPGVDEQRVVVWSEQHIKDILKQTHIDMPAAHRWTANEPVRLIRSSGTTGGQKGMLIDAQLMERRLEVAFRVLGSDSDAHFLVTLFFTVNAAYAYAVMSLRLGATLYSGDPVEMLSRYPIDRVYILPTSLDRTVRGLPKDFQRPPKLALETAGAALSASLRAEVNERITDQVRNLYGSNEVGAVSMVGEDGVGRLLPGVQIQILDEKGKAVPAGTPGLVGIHTATMVPGYLDNAEANARCFKSGWFYPGDIGQLLPHRGLKILGRADELLNFGGVKQMPRDWEVRIEALPEVKEAGMVMIEQDGRASLCIGIVLMEGVDFEAVGTQIQDLLPRFPGEVRLAMLNRLPQTETGKLRRPELKEFFRSIAEKRDVLH